MKSLIAFFTLICTFVSSLLVAACFDDSCNPSVDFSLGWRHDDLDWKTHRLRSHYIPGHASSRIHFKDIDSYTASATAKWAGSAYYIRCSAEYGLTDKGRAREIFKINSPYLYCPVSVETSDPIKRRSEVYDFDAAIGYPFVLCCSRLNIVPLVGFSFHRQHLRVKGDDFYCSSCSSSSSSSYCYSDDLSDSSSSDCENCEYYYTYSDRSSCSKFFHCHSSDSFYVSSSNPFRSSPSSNPFGESSSDPNIASALGLGNFHRTSNYRFTWYGFYLGTDIAYALDCDWTLFTELEFHFLDRCHRKRKSWTGVRFVDDYHKEDWAYGFNGVVGVTYSLSTCWYTTLAVDFNWWKSDDKHDKLEWKKVGAKIGLGYMF